MSDKNFTEKKWRELASKTYAWSDSVQLTTGTEILPKSVVALSLGESKEADAPLTLNAKGLPESVKEKILDSLNLCHWKGQGSQTVAIDGTAYVVIAPVKIKTSLPQKARAYGLEFAKFVKANHPEKVSIFKPEGFCTTEIFMGLASGLYAANGFKGVSDTTSKSSLPQSVQLMHSDATPEELTQVKHLVKCSSFVRFLQDAPPNYLDPVKFAEIAEDICREYSLEYKIHNKDDIRKLKMGSFLSVNGGSITEPRMIEIKIKGKDSTKTVSFCGKGLTFDSGGLSLKPSAGMEDMKFDMSGGGAVLGMALYLSKYKPAKNIVCLVGATENLVASGATRPSDVVVAMNGKTIEVLNTDAEGRLVLADLLHYTNTHHKPDLIVDIATLTGAVLMALGTVGSAVLSNDEGSAMMVLESARTVGEPMWQLPIWPELENEVKGTTGDLQNIAKPSVKAGTVMAAAFLQEFVGKTKWVHLDIAGTANDCKAVGYPSVGGCAYGMRTMIQIAMKD